MSAISGGLTALRCGRCSLFKCNSIIAVTGKKSSREKFTSSRRRINERQKASCTTCFVVGSPIAHYPSKPETRAEKSGSYLSVMSVIFFFMPFVITVLVVVGEPLISTIGDLSIGAIIKL